MSDVVRSFNQFKGSIEKGIIELTGSVTVNASGTVVATDGYGLLGVTTTKAAGTGEYNLVLDRHYNRFLSGYIRYSGGQNLEASVIGVKSDGTSQWTDVNEINIVLKNPANGSPTNISSASILMVILYLKNSSV